MEQLKIARQNAELGHYSIAANAYKAALLSYGQRIQAERDAEKRNRLVDVRFYFAFKLFIHQFVFCRKE